MVGSHLKRGLVTGVVGGTVFGVFVGAVASPLVAVAESYESGVAGQATGSTVSLSSVGGGVLWGLLLGIVAFGVVFYVLEPAIPGSRSTKSYLLAGAGFLVVSGTPWLVIPPQPPGVESALPPATRIGWYVVAMGFGVVVTTVSGYGYTRFSHHGRGWAILAAALPFGLLVVLALVAPRSPPSGGIPPDLIASFRGLVVFSQAGLWFTLAAVHGYLLERGRPADDTDGIGVEEIPTAGQ